jgi:hypothetical protein
VVVTTRRAARETGGGGLIMAKRGYFEAPEPRFAMINSAHAGLPRWSVPLGPARRGVTPL